MVKLIVGYMAGAVLGAMLLLSVLVVIDLACAIYRQWSLSGLVAYIAALVVVSELMYVMSSYVKVVDVRR